MRRLEESVAAQVEALTRRDTADWAKADALFHDLIIEATGNERMRAVMRELDGEILRVRAAMIFQREQPHQSVEEHRAVVAAIRARDGELARQLHLRHRDRALAEYEQIASQMQGLVTGIARLGQDAVRDEERHLQ